MNAKSYPFKVGSTACYAFGGSARVPTRRAPYSAIRERTDGYAWSVLVAFKDERLTAA